MNEKRMARRDFVAGVAMLAAYPLLAWAAPAETSGDPWPQSDLIEPGQLAKLMAGSGSKPEIVCVTFPTLYRARHIARAEYAGPGSTPAGLEALHRLLSGIDKSRAVVLYCGCCPMTECPNIRPAYQAAREMGFVNLKVLNLPNNFHADWFDRGFPVES